MVSSQGTIQNAKGEPGVSFLTQPQKSHNFYLILLVRMNSSDFYLIQSARILDRAWIPKGNNHGSHQRSATIELTGLSARSNELIKFLTHG